MKLGYRNKLSNKILLVFIALALVPILLLGVKLVRITSGHMEKDVKAWEKLQPEYKEQAAEFHEGMKERLRTEVVSYALYSSFIAIFIALLSSNVILKPLRNLMEGARRLGTGDLDYRLQVKGGDEISRLAAAFNSMADSLQSRNKELLHKNKELYALNTISAITSQSLNLEEILRNTLKEVISIIGMDAGSIYLADDQKREIACAAHIGVPVRLAGQTERFRFGEDMPGQSAITGEALAISDVSADPRVLSHIIKNSGMKGYLCFPLKSKDKVQGILCVFSAAEHSYTRNEIDFLESVGHIVGVAIENIKLYDRERSRLSSLVRLEKNRAEAILLSLAEAVYTTDRESRITYWNRAAETITGFKAKDVIGRTCSEVLAHENDNGDPLCGASCIMRKNVSLKGEAQTALCMTESGAKLPTALTSAPIRDASGDEIGRVAVFRDVTREKEIDRMKTDFVRTVSHELRTPLSAIVGMTEMLIDDEVREARAKEYIETIHTEGQRLASMVEDLLDIAKIEDGRHEFRKETVLVQPIIDDCIHILAGQASSKQISIQWDGAMRLPPIQADRNKFYQVVFNLLNNAISYSDSNSSIRIHADTKDGRLALSLEDTGWGIPEHDLPHIFKKFYRSDTHAPRVKGTGLGLPLVLEIVRAHNGTIDVESAPGRGSRFTVNIPLAKEA